MVERTCVAGLFGMDEWIGGIDMGLGMELEPIDIIILTYYRDADTKGIELFWLLKSAERRMSELVAEWGDVGNWGHSLKDGTTTAKNNRLGGIIQIFTREVHEDGEES